MANSSLRALVTGATGFIGGHLCRLLEQTGWDVHAIVRRESSEGKVSGLAPKTIIHRFSGNTEELCRIVGDHPPDIAFHLASRFIVDHKPSQVSELVKSNVEFGAQLIEALSQSGIRCLVNAGTSWQHYGNAEYDPVNLYAATKQAFEQLLPYYASVHSLRVVTLKLFDTYGPGDTRGKIMQLLVRVAKGTEALEMSEGKQLIDLVHVTDVAKAFLVSAERVLSGKVAGHESYAVGSGAPVTLRRLVEIFSECRGREPP